MIDDDYIARGGFMRIPGVRSLNVLNNDGSIALSTSWPHPVDAVISLQDRRRTLKMFMDEPVGENVPVIGLPLKLDRITVLQSLRMSPFLKDTQFIMVACFQWIQRGH